MKVSGLCQSSKSPNKTPFFDKFGKISVLKILSDTLADIWTYFVSK
jgi:hypothetical protein